MLVGFVIWIVHHRKISFPLVVHLSLMGYVDDENLKASIILKQVSLTGRFPKLNHGGFPFLKCVMECSILVRPDLAVPTAGKGFAI